VDKNFSENCDLFKIKSLNFEPMTAEYIVEQIDMIKALIAKGFVYVAPDGSVYFKISVFERYGDLSNLENRQFKTQELDSAVKKNLADEYDRENVSDFALWKSSKAEDGDIFWESSWGNGRPGWHIECGAMAKKYIGDTIDLHSGGIDLKFRHHEEKLLNPSVQMSKSFPNIGCTWHIFSLMEQKCQKIGKFIGLERDFRKEVFCPRFVI
jgi:cysteinyl-tRNA synthetase